MDFIVIIIMQKLSSILIFYKPFFYWSFAINILLTIFNPKVITAIATKLMLVVLLRYILKQANGGKILNYYKEIGISSFILFTSLFIMDIIITITYLFIIKEFI